MVDSEEGEFLNLEGDLEVDLEVDSEVDLEVDIEVDLEVQLHPVLPLLVVSIASGILVQVAVLLLVLPPLAMMDPLPPPQLPLLVVGLLHHPQLLHHLSLDLADFLDI